MNQNERHLLTLEKTITNLKARRLSIESQITILEHDYKVTMELIKKSKGNKQVSKR